MTIIIKNKQTLSFKEFTLKCCIGRNGSTSKKKEGDKKTPKGTFSIDKLYIRNDRIKVPETNLEIIKIRKNMGWCDDVNAKLKYNKLVNIKENVHYEKLFRKDNKYDLLIPIKYNWKNPKVPKGSAIFIHLTKDYKPTLGCVGLSFKDFLILIKLINKETKIKIL